MNIHGFVLGVSLLALVGLCMLQESFKQTQARYKLAELTRREDEMKKRLGFLRTQEEEMRSPPRLRLLAQQKCPHLVALGSATPEPIAASGRRRPGEIEDDPRRIALEEDAEMASAEQR